MSDLGSLFFSLGLDSQKFDEAIKKAKEKVAELTGEASITINADASNVAAQVQDDLNKITGKKTEIKLGIDKSSKASVEDLVKDIANAEKELERLKSKESWNTAAIGRQEGFVANLKRQLEEAKAVKVAATEAKEAISNIAQSTQTVQHIVREADINLVRELKEELVGVNEQLELRNRLEQGKRDAADKNKAEREEAARVKAEQKAIENAQKKAAKEEKARIKAEEKAAKDAEREEAARLRRLDKESKAVQKQQLAEQKVLEGRKKMQEEEYNLTRWARKQEVANSSIYESAEYRREQNLLKKQYEDEERAAKAKIANEVALEKAARERAEISAQWIGEQRKHNKEIAKQEAERIRQEEKELELMAKKRKFSADWINNTRTQNEVQKRNETSVSRSELQNQLTQLQRLEEAIKKLQYTKVDIDTSDVDKDSEAYKKAAKALDSYIDKLQEMQSSGKRLKGREVTDAIGIDMNRVIAQSTSSVAEQIRIQRKATVEATRAKKEEEGRVKLVDKLANKLKNSSDWASQLNNQLTNAFSIYSIERFIRSLYTVGGEFQKQQIALQNMIGDAEKGNVVFERMKDLAVKSPFTFSDLASYTKQMAAYGIEYEELYDTTKRLADISAGVGVDMGRLILAYGQVRSAEVLRGQELRQFTEAGIPLVAELAKRLSEVRGEAVKVGEVFDAISKRQVSFDMVKDVLFDMTDPGGRFFEMQEELAKSLAGQWSNLKDAWDIMIADIANSSNNILSKAAGFFSDILRSWREWIPVLTAIAGAIGVVTSAIRVATTATTILNAVSNANPWMKLASIILGAAGAIGGWVLGAETAVKNTNQLNAELDEEVQKWNENRANALRYIDTLKSANTSEERRILLYKELLDLYPEIFKNMKMEELMLMSSADLKTKINEETTKQQLARIEKEIEDERLVVKYIKDSQKRKTARGAMVVRSLSDDEKAKLDAAESRIAELEERKVKLQRDIDRKGLIKALTPDSDISKYIEVYRELGKAVKILRKGGILGEITNPKEGTSILEYYDQLNSALKEQNEIKEKFKPTTNEYKEADNLAKIYQNAIDAIGGVWKKSKKGGKSEAEKSAERDAKAYYDTLKAELTKISSQWDLYKEIFDVTGNKTLALNLAFDGKIPGFDNYIDHLKGEMAKEIKKRGLGITPDELLSMGKEGIASKVNDKTATVWTEDVAKNLNLLIDRYNQAGNKLRKESIDNFLEIIKASKDFAQQIEDEANNLQRALNTIYSMPIPVEEKRRMEAQAYDNYEEKVAEINFEKFKKTSGWVKIFDDLTKVSTGTLDGLLVDIEEFLPQGVESEEVFKALIKAIRDIKDELLERNPFRAFGSNVNSELGEINDKIKEYNRQIKEAKKNGNIDLVKNLEDKKHEEESRRKEIYDNYSTAFKHGMDKISEFANAVGEVSSMLEKFGNESLKNFGQFLDSITSGMQSGFNVGSLFGGVGGVIGGFVGAATGAMAGLVDAGRKAVAAEQERSQIVIDRLDKVASLLKEKIADSLTGLYNSTLDATSRMEMTLQKEKYDAAEKYYKDKGVDINPNTWYATTFDNTSFSWDTNEYLIYSKKTHEAINKALEADNEYMAMYASLLAQRDEMLYQQATYTDKDSEDVEAFKRDKQIEIEKITMEIEQLSKDMMSSLYSVDFQDWSSQLANSIVNAWATGEDAAKAYEGTVSDIMRNVATSLVRQQVIGEYLNKNLKPFIDEFIAKNGIMDEQMFSTLGDIVDGVGDRTDDALKFMDSLEKVMNEKGLTLKDLSDSSEKGGLSKGIQSVTEDTANLLASYVNSMRADLSVNRTLIEQFVSVDVPQMSIIARAQLQQLQQVAANTRRNADAADRIYELVNKVVDKGGNKLRI